MGHDRQGKRTRTGDGEDAQLHPFRHTEGAATETLFSVQRFDDGEDFSPEGRFPCFFDR